MWSSDQGAPYLRAPLLGPEPFHLVGLGMAKGTASRRSPFSTGRVVSEMEEILAKEWAFGQMSVDRHLLLIVCSPSWRKHRVIAEPPETQCAIPANGYGVRSH